MSAPAIPTADRSSQTGPAVGGSPKELTDLAVLIGGQGGDGTLTVADLLARYFHRRGLYVYLSRNVLSRIRGGHADSSVRASVDPTTSIKSEMELIVAFDAQSLELGLPELAPDGLVLYDSSSFHSDRPNAIGLPFATLAGSQLGQPIYKNTTAYGVVSYLLGFDPAETRAVIEERFQRRSPEALEKNLKAIEIGRKAAAEHPELAQRWSVAKGSLSGYRIMAGNQAVALGFVVGGGRFFAGYPITPATEIMEYLGRYLPSMHGVVRQAEDELASINMVIGAAYAGARAMTSTSGPGLSLMTEGIGHAGAAEIPILVADCQRVGPSTGQPTRHEQSDLSHLVHIGHGEFPRFVISPGSIEDCFYLTIDALNLAERWRLPVILLLDQALCQNGTSTPPFDLNGLRVDRGKRLSAEEVAKLEAYQYYKFTPDGSSPYAPPGTPGITAQVTGNEHDEFGHVSVNIPNRNKMMAKRMEKLIHALPELPRPRTFGEPTARIGLIAYGSTEGPVREAQEILAAKGTPTKFLQIRTIFPVLTDTIVPFLESVDVAYVVEHNYTGQLAALLRGAMPEHHKRIQSIVKYDGFSFRGPELVAALEGRKNGPVR
ncbi:MAG: 2-oxoacid:acceptor oxidoreductase subunit alpha [Thermoplasmata archaeon]|nr:2-oxoacid:acceptor oxidoreductase subunit alpha [Thermoplasmata archaeon]